MATLLQRFSYAAARDAEVFQAVFDIDRLRSGGGGAPGTSVTSLSQRAAARVAQQGEEAGPLAEWLAAHASDVVKELFAMRRRLRQRLGVLAVAEAGAALIGLVAGHAVFGAWLAGIGAAVVLALLVAVLLLKPLLKPL